MDNQRDLTNAELRYAQAIREYNTSLAQLQRRTGLDALTACPANISAGTKARGRGREHYRLNPHHSKQPVRWFPSQVRLNQPHNPPAPVMSSALSSNQLSSLHLLLDRIAERQRSDFGNIVSDIKPDSTLITACDRWSDTELVQGLSAIAPGEVF